MITPAVDENQLAADVEELKKQFANTQLLYKEVCALMFLRYGMTPTVNRLYQLVRRGSMSVPSDALRQFWQELREKSRVRIEHPDLPDALKTAAAESLAAMWTLAQQAATDGLTASRAEAAEEVRAAQAVARDQAAAFEAAEARLTALLGTERRRADDLSGRLADREAAYARLADQRTTDQAAHARQLAAAAQAEAIAASERDVARKELQAAQADTEKILATFNAQLDKFREDSAASEARHVAIERRALLDLDQERQRSNRLAKQLEQAQQKLNETMSEQARAVATLQNQIGSLQARLGESEGRLAAAREDSGRWQATCERLQSELARQQQIARADAAADAKASVSAAPRPRSRHDSETGAKAHAQRAAMADGPSQATAPAISAAKADGARATMVDAGPDATPDATANANAGAAPGAMADGARGTNVDATPDATPNAAANTKAAEAKASRHQPKKAPR